MTITIYQACWCAGQVTLLAALGGAAASVWLRRNPAATARVANAAAMTILSVTLFGLSPIPWWSCWQLFPGQSAAAAPHADRSLATAEPSLPLRTARMIDLYNVLAGSLRATAQRPASRREFRWIVVIAALGIGIGLARLVSAVRYLCGLYRQSLPLADERVVVIASQLAAALGVSQHFELRQSARLASPAVIGWRRPVILLPAAYSVWTAEQLRSEFAHELAHIRRGDSLTRLTTSLATASISIIRWSTGSHPDSS